MSLTNDEIDALLAVVEGATAGPWHVTDGLGGTWVVDDGGGIPGGLSAAISPHTRDMPGVVAGNTGHNATYIATFDPPTVTALLEAARRASELEAMVQAVAARHRRSDKSKPGTDGNCADCGHAMPCGSLTAVTENNPGLTEWYKAWGIEVEQKRADRAEKRANRYEEALRAIAKPSDDWVKASIARAALKEDQ